MFLRCANIIKCKDPLAISFWIQRTICVHNLIQFVFFQNSRNFRFEHNLRLWIAMVRVDWLWQWPSMKIVYAALSRYGTKVSQKFQTEISVLFSYWLFCLTGVSFLTDENVPKIFAKQVNKNVGNHRLSILDMSKNNQKCRKFRSKLVILSVIQSKNTLKTVLACSGAEMN